MLSLGRSSPTEVSFQVGSEPKLSVPGGRSGRCMLWVTGTVRNAIRAPLVFSLILCWLIHFSWAVWAPLCLSLLRLPVSPLVLPFQSSAFFLTTLLVNLVISHIFCSFWSLTTGWFGQCKQRLENVDTAALSYLHYACLQPMQIAEVIPCFVWPDFRWAFTRAFIHLWNINMLCSRKENLWGHTAVPVLLLRLKRCPEEQSIWASWRNGLFYKSAPLPFITEGSLWDLN